MLAALQTLSPAATVPAAPTVLLCAPDRSAALALSLHLQEKGWLAGVEGEDSESTLQVLACSDEAAYRANGPRRYAVVLCATLPSPALLCLRVRQTVEGGTVVLFGEPSALQAVRVLYFWQPAYSCPCSGAHPHCAPSCDRSVQHVRLLHPSVHLWCPRSRCGSCVPRTRGLTLRRRSRHAKFGAGGASFPQLGVPRLRYRA